MTAAEITLVKDTIRKIVPIADQAAALFYARLFELDPSLRALFSGDMAEQGRKLMAMIATAVAALERIEMIVPMVRKLGIRHIGYGVRDDHYATVGDALLWTLEKGLGSDFTPSLRDAWTSLYSLLANTMMNGSREAQAAAV